MGLIRINPTKILVGGDKKAAMTFAGPARSQLEILKQGMSFQNLSQGIRRVWLNENVYVECKKIFNYQECKIWVRPAIAADEEGQGQDIYFYVRIVHRPVEDMESDAFLKKTRKDTATKYMDRLIIWRCRDEIKSDDVKVGIFEDQGQYEDETHWAITRKGAVILDVDVISRTVYTESGLISVETDKTTAELLDLADRYIAKIKEDENIAYFELNGESKRPPDLSEYIRGPIISPFLLDNACRASGYFYWVSDAWTGEVTPQDPIPGTDPDGDPCDFYYMNDYAPEGCDPPDRIFNLLQWPKLDINKDKYLTTKRDERTGGTRICGGSIGYVADAYDPDAGYTAYLGTSTGNCSLKGDWEEEREYQGGSFYTTNGTYPCFFIFLMGITGSIEAKLQGVADVDGSLSTKSNDTGGILLSRNSTNYFITTPLEEMIHYDEFVLEPDAGLGAIAKQMYNWANTEGGSITVEHSYELKPEGSTEGVGDPWSWGSGIIAHLPAFVTYADTNWDPLNETYGWHSYAEGMATVLRSINRFEDTISIVKPEVALKRFKKYLAVAIFKDTSARVNAAACGSWNIDPDAEGLDWPYVWCRDTYNDTYTSYPTDYIPHFEIGMVFYIIFPKFNFKRVGDEEIYWDIHSEREIVQEEINHNRELDLEEYVSTILKGFKELPENFDSDAGEYLDLRDQGYDITNGFTYQLH